MVIVVATVPREMERNLEKKMMKLVNVVHDTLQKRDEIYFKKIDTNNKSVKAL